MSSDDIVEKLRAAARSGDLPLGRSFNALAVADEIERLRAEAADWQRTVQAQESVAETLRAVVAEKHAEIERLRAVVADYENGINWHTTCMNCARLMDDNYAQYCEIERLRAAGDALAATWPEEDRCGCDNKDCRAVVKAFDDWQEARRG